MNGVSLSTLSNKCVLILYKIFLKKINLGTVVVRDIKSKVTSETTSTDVVGTRNHLTELSKRYKGNMKERSRRFI